MDEALPSFVLGYHGCDADTAKHVIAGSQQLKPSTNDYDWLGEGVYFWEHNAQRAYEFSKTMAKRPHPSGQKIKTPAVVGAVIDLGYCLNLLDSRYIAMVRQTHEELVALFNAMGQALPENTGGDDLVDRKLDCAVLRHLHTTRADKKLRPFDTVRAAFFEGKALYHNAGFASATHLQIAVRDPARIIGYFHPRNEQGKLRKFR